MAAEETSTCPQSPQHWVVREGNKKRPFFVVFDYEGVFMYSCFVNI